MWSFEQPEFFLLLLVLPVGIYFRHRWKGRGGRLLFPFRIWQGASFAPTQRGIRILLFLSSTAFWLGAAALVIAMAGPVRTVRDRVFLSRGIDVMIVLDQSPSMSARDFPPENRFETARQVIRNFVSGRENDPIGLVTFGSEAALRVPPTLDYRLLTERLEGVSIMELGEATAIGMGIAVASLHLRASSAREKVIILLTDGANNAGEILPGTAAEIAAQMGIRIYTIGIGSSEEVPIQYTDPATGRIFRGSFQGGFDEELLKEVAATSGGAYFRASSPGSMQAIFNTIDSIETVEKRSRIRVRTVPLHRMFILMSLCLVFLDVLVRKFLLREVL